MKKIMTLVLITILSLAFSSAASAELVGFWRFNEGQGTIAYDSSNFGNDGTIYGASWTSGRVGGALSFDGQNDYVDVGDVPTLDISSAITLEAWIMTDSNETDTIISKDDDGSNREYYLGLSYDGFNPGRVRWALKTNVFATIDSSITVNDGQWHYIAATYDGQYMRLYIDGIEDANSPVTQTGLIPNTQVAFRIGAMSDVGYEQYFQGKIDEARAYNHALSLDEIIADMNYGLVGTPPVANAGDDQRASANTTVVLDGSNSYDPNGQIVNYEWSRLPNYFEDYDIIYSGPNSTCETKALGRVEEVIQLIVTDNEGLMSEPDTMTIFWQRPQN
jgi:hypothetical protein